MTKRSSSAAGRFENRESGCKMLGETFRGCGEAWVTGSRDNHRSWRGSKPRNGRYRQLWLTNLLLMHWHHSPASKFCLGHWLFASIC